MYCCAWCKNFKDAGDAGKEKSDGFCFIVGQYVRCEDVCDEFEKQEVKEGKGVTNMTNREWLNTLSVEEKEKILVAICNFCSCDCVNEYGSENRYDERIKEWLNKKHKEPMPTLKVGDIVQTKPYCRYVAIDPIILVRAESKERVFLCDIGDIVMIWRSEGAEYKCIWEG